MAKMCNGGFIKVSNDECFDELFRVTNKLIAY
jgi:hypothetical protein